MKDKNGCAYPGCVNYKYHFKKYCCNACMFDHTEAKRLRIRFTHKKKEKDGK